VVFEKLLNELDTTLTSSYYFAEEGNTKVAKLKLVLLTALLKKKGVV